MTKSNQKLVILFLIVACISIMGFSSLTSSVAENYYRTFINSPAVSSINLDSFNVGLSTGAATYNYDIEVLKGVNDFQPSVRLFYNSQLTNAEPGLVGSAWGISQSYIQRNINYTRDDSTDDYFVLNLNGISSRLIFSNSDNYYHTEVESFYNSNKMSGGSNQKGEYWVVRTKDGTTYRFGYNSDSEQLSNLENFVSRWYLDTVTDVNGNNIFYSYSENPYSGDSGATYPKKIEYNNDKSRVIEFVLEGQNRQDSYTYYLQGNKVKQTKRIGEIRVSNEGQLVRKYSLQYVNPDLSMKSLISNITLYGNNGTSKQPPVVFSYYLNKGWQETTLWRPPATLGGNVDWGVRLDDVNRDGFVDTLRGYKAGSFSDDSGKEVVEIWINDRKGGWIYNASYGFPYSFARTSTYYVYTCRKDGVQYGIDRGMRTVDINGDGFLDVLSFPHKSSSGSIDRNLQSGAFLGNGLTWMQNSSLTPPDIRFITWNQDDEACKNYYGIDVGARFIDLNGDGLPDVVRRSYYQRSDPQTFINQGGRLVQTNLWTLPFDIAGAYRIYADWHCNTQYGVDMGLRFIDINGDGLTDMLSGRVIWSTINENSVWINDGKNFVQDNSISNPVNFVTTLYDLDISCNSRTGIDTGVRLVDINGDGLVDLVDKNNVRINTGTGWVTDSSWTIPNVNFVTATGDNSGVRLVDINGDGLVDIISDGKNWINNASKSFLLKSIKTESGAEIKIDYMQSSSLDNTNGDNISDVGFNLWLVKSINKTNGLNDSNSLSSTTIYNYSGGLYDYGEKEFRGFAIVQEYLPDGSKKEHRFHQDKPRNGLEFNYTFTDSTGMVRASIINVFDYQRINNSYYIVQLSKTEQKELNPYSGEASLDKDETTTFKYDSFGNIIEKKYSGLTYEDQDYRDDEGSNNKSFTYSYSYNKSNWVLDKLNKETLLDFKGNQKKQTLYYYDYQNDTSFVGKGLLTKTESWFDNGANPIVEFKYDSFGNIIEKKDPNGGKTKFKYDVSGVDMIEEENSLGQKNIFKYDSFGNIIEKKDPNGFVVSYVYDYFGRVIKEIREYDSLDFPTTEFSYENDGIAPESVLVKKREQTGLPATFDSYEYYDGFGNKIQSKKEATNGKFITTDFTYDYFLRLKRTTNPYYSGSGTYTLPSAVPSTSYVYDALNKITLIKNADGTNKTMEYYDKSLFVFDENGNKNRYDFDTYGNIIQSKEYEPDGEEFLGFNYLYYTYDAQNNLVKVDKEFDSDKLEGIKYTYDSLGRKIAMNDPDLGNWTYSYDSNGNLVNQLDGRGDSVVLGYDSLNRLISKQSSSGKFNYTYDLKTIGVLSYLDSGNTSTEYSYDRRLRLIKETQNIDGFSFVTNYTYDSFDRLIRKILPNGKIISYSYDSAGNLNSIQGVLENLTYNEANLVVSKYYVGTGTTSNFVYSSDNLRLSQISTNNSKQNKLYSYDKIGNVLSINDVLLGKKVDYSYDFLDRLVRANQSSGYSQSYEYDAAGNLLKVLYNGKKIVFNSSEEYLPPEKVIDSTISSPPYLVVNDSYTFRENDLAKIVPNVSDQEEDLLKVSYTLPFNENGSWQTNYDSAGIYNVSVSVFDGKFTVSKNFTVIVLNKNRAPIITNLKNITVQEGSIVSLNISATDPDGDNLTFNYPNPFDAYGRWITGYNSAGIYRFAVNVSDGQYFATGLITVDVQNVNRPPIINISDTIIVNEGDLISLVANIFDPDGDNFTSSYTYPLNASGKWQTNYTSAGQYLSTVFANDGNLTSNKTFLIIVNALNRAPVINPFKPITVEESELVKVMVNATDPDGDQLKIYYQNPLDSNGEWQTGYYNSGNYNLGVIVSDGKINVTGNASVRVNACSSCYVNGVLTLPDLVVSELGFNSLDKNPLVENSKVYPTFTLLNNGNLEAKNVVWRFDTGQGVETGTITSIKSGKSETIKLTKQYTIIGNVTLSVLVDGSNAIREVKENNNNRSSLFRVAEKKPDLSISKFVLYNTAKYPPTENKELYFELIIDNTGNEVASNIPLQIEQDGKLIYSSKISSLKAGKNTNQKIKVIPVGEGYKEFVLVVDKSNAVRELNENNNNASMIVQVKKNRPDLRLEGLGFDKITKYPPVIGKNSYPMFYIVNDWAEAASNVEWRFNVGSAVYTGTVSKIKANEKYLVKVKNVYRNVGQFPFEAEVDYNSKILELDETNNKVVKTVRIPSGQVI